MADHDLAIKDLVYSAFGHNGQKCSAASLAVLEAEVYDNPVFMKQLRDAAASLPVGPAWDLSSKVTPLISPPAGPLQRAQTTLEPGESWLLEPQMIDGNSNLWSPGIKLGVKPGSFYHKNECFGPVLGLMRADDLEHALEIVNSSEFGLTSGFHSLDDREVAIWREKIEVGNAYINRGTTGAIVQRQPFGGWKRSAFGPGAKAGGPNYVLSLGTWHCSKQLPVTSDQLTEQLTDNSQQSTINNYQAWWDNYFSLEHDPSQVLGESNILRYVPLKRVALVTGGAENGDQLQLAAEAAQVCGVAVETFTLGDLSSEQQLIAALDRFDRIRLVGTPSEALLRAAHAAHVPVINAPISRNGRLELRYYLQEQAMTETLHRYGNIMPKPEGR